MSEYDYSNLELAEKTQQFFINFACFIIQIKFLEAEQTWFKRIFISNFLILWNDLLLKKSEKVDFTILVDFKVMEGRSKEKDEMKYFSSLKWDHHLKTVTLIGIQNVWVLQSALRYLLMYLIKGRGFLFHGSVVSDSNNRLHIFSAKSGGGKSTTAAWIAEISGYRIIADDTVVIIREGSKWVCYSSGMVEKAFLPTYFKKDDFRIYFVHKSKILKKSKLSSSIEKLKSILEQVWMLDKKVDEETYNLVASFIKTATLYELRLPLRSDDILEVINED